MQSKAKTCLAWAVILALATLAGCSRARAPLGRHDAEGARVLYKRLPRQMYVDEFRRFDRVAYHPGSEYGLNRTSEEQNETIEEYGAPEYYRKPFESTGGEKVLEWLYPRHNLLVQWIDGDKAYQGAMTDMERTLLERGWPDYAWTQRDRFDHERQTWTYNDEIDGSRQVLSFANGRMIYRRVRN